MLNAPRVTNWPLVKQGRAETGSVTSVTREVMGTRGGARRTRESLRKVAVTMTFVLPVLKKVRTQVSSASPLLVGMLW